MENKLNITACLAVKGQLHLTKEAYKRFRERYPTEWLSISSSEDEATWDWLDSVANYDPYLKFIHHTEQLSFGQNWNSAINQAPTDKVVLIHNDMVLGNEFLEHLDEKLTEDIILTYTTIEPPIFPGHDRAGKLIRECGRNFETFDDEKFRHEVNVYKMQQMSNTMLPGCAFFCSGYKDSFTSIGGFDGNRFKPYFCEDDDLMIRFKLDGKQLLTTNYALVYHFVSQTSRFSEEAKKNTAEIEQKSNIAFIEKWRCPISAFHEAEFWLQGTRIKRFKVQFIFGNLVPMTAYDGLKQFADSAYYARDLGTHLYEGDYNVFINIPAMAIRNEDIEFIVKHQILLSNMSLELGMFTVGNLNIMIRNLDTIERSLITC